MIEKFVEENISRDVKNFVHENDLYTRYLAFCTFHELDPITKIQLNIQLKKLTVGVRHKRTRNRVRETGRQGVKLLPCKY